MKRKGGCYKYGFKVKKKNIMLRSCIYKGIKLITLSQRVKQYKIVIFCKFINFINLIFNKNVLYTLILHFILRNRTFE